VANGAAHGASVLDTWLRRQEEGGTIREFQYYVGGSNVEFQQKISESNN
jgi:hypothetical protein